MPWDKRKADDKWEVINSDTGEVKGTHDTEPEADDQLAALYANADPEEESKMEKRMDLFIPITKINAERHEVWGYGAIEERDNSDEILDYQSSKPHFLDWSQKAQKRSGGKSKGNVRAMHQPIAAGKLIDLRADDVRKGFFVGAKIVDEDEWKKVEAGVYTGFSVGGSYVKRWSDYQNPGAVRYTAKPTELSIVDAPCIPSATFEMVKADGISRLGFKPALGRNLIKVIEAPRMIKVVRGDAMEKADFDESKHPRANDGKFTSGGGGGGGSKASESKPAKKPEMHHPLHDTPDTVIGRDFEPHPTNSGSKSTHDAKITTHHPLHNTPDTVIGSDGKPHPATQTDKGNKNFIQRAGQFKGRAKSLRQSGDKEGADLMEQASLAAINLHRHQKENNLSNEELASNTNIFSNGLKHYRGDMKVNDLLNSPAAQPSSPKAESPKSGGFSPEYHEERKKKLAESQARMDARRPDGTPDYYNMEPMEADQVKGEIDNGQRPAIVKPDKSHYKKPGETNLSFNSRMLGTKMARSSRYDKMSDEEFANEVSGALGEQYPNLSDDNARDVIQSAISQRRERHEVNKVTKGAVMDKITSVYKLLEKAEQELADELPAEEPAAPAPAAENMEVPEDLEKLPDEEPAPESVDGDTFDESELDDEAEKLDDEPAHEMAAADAGYAETATSPEEVLKVIQSTVIGLAELLIKAENALQKQDKVPGAPEPISDIPLKGEVGASFNVEQMPAPSVLLEIKPNAEPPQATLAEHAVMSKDLAAAFDAWLPKVGAMVKSAVAEEVARVAADLQKATKSAPVRMIPVVKKDNHKEGVSA